MNVAVIGSGAWGCALADHLSRRAGHGVALYARRAEIRDALAATRVCATLPGFPVHAGVGFPASLPDAVKHGELIVLALPSTAIPVLAGELAPHLAPGALVISAAKGILPGSGLRISEVLAAALPGHRETLGVLSGPSFARGLMAGDPTAVVTAAAGDATARSIQKAVTAGTLRAYASTDVLGVEIGGAVKNVLALATGIAEGLGLGPNSQAALITRGLKEMADLATALGGRFETCMGLSGLGDLVLTATGNESRNRTVGRRIGRGDQLADILSSLGEVAEGVETSRSVLLLADRHGIEMPICREVAAVLFGGIPPRQAIQDLLSRPLKSEAPCP
jgi:glycerol-3-phosphate dehydrogenase (NAD(P)+)